MFRRSPFRRSPFRRSPFRRSPFRRSPFRRSPFRRSPLYRGGSGVHRDVPRGSYCDDIIKCTDNKNICIRKHDEPNHGVCEYRERVLLIVGGIGNKFISDTWFGQTTTTIDKPYDDLMQKLNSKFDKICNMSTRDDDRIFQTDCDVGRNTYYLAEKRTKMDNFLRGYVARNLSVSILCLSQGAQATMKLLADKPEYLKNIDNILFLEPQLYTGEITKDKYYYNGLTREDADKFKLMCVRNNINVLYLFGRSNNAFSHFEKHAANGYLSKDYFKDQKVKYVDIRLEGKCAHNMTYIPNRGTNNYTRACSNVVKNEIEEFFDF
jgi:hypothetical protein